MSQIIKFVVFAALLVRALCFFRSGRVVVPSKRILNALGRFQPNDEAHLKKEDDSIVIKAARGLSRCVTSKVTEWESDCYADILTLRQPSSDNEARQLLEDYSSISASLWSGLVTLSLSHDPSLSGLVCFGTNILASTTNTISTQSPTSLLASLIRIGGFKLALALNKLKNKAIRVFTTQLPIVTKDEIATQRDNESKSPLSRSERIAAENRRILDEKLHAQRQQSIHSYIGKTNPTFSSSLPSTDKPVVLTSQSTQLDTEGIESHIVTDETKQIPSSTTDSFPAVSSDIPAHSQDKLSKGDLQSFLSLNPSSVLPSLSLSPEALEAKDLLLNEISTVVGAMVEGAEKEAIAVKSVVSSMAGKIRLSHDKTTNIQPHATKAPSDSLPQMEVDESISQESGVEGVQSHAIVAEGDLQAQSQTDDAQIEAKSTPKEPQATHMMMEAATPRISQTSTESVVENNNVESVEKNEEAAPENANTNTNTNTKVSKSLNSDLEMWEKWGKDIKWNAIRTGSAIYEKLQADSAPLINSPRYSLAKALSPTVPTLSTLRDNPGKLKQILSAAAHSSPVHSTKRTSHHVNQIQSQPPAFFPLIRKRQSKSSPSPRQLFTAPTAVSFSRTSEAVPVTMPRSQGEQENLESRYLPFVNSARGGSRALAAAQRFDQRSASLFSTSVDEVSTSLSSKSNLSSASSRSTPLTSTIRTSSASSKATLSSPSSPSRSQSLPSSRSSNEQRETFYTSFHSSPTSAYSNLDLSSFERYGQGIDFNTFRTGSSLYEQLQKKQASDRFFPSEHN